MPVGLPDWWYGRRLPEPTLGPLHVKLCAVGEPTKVNALTYAVTSDPVPEGQVWQIHKIWLAKSHSQLAQLMLAWPVRPVTEVSPGFDGIYIADVLHEYMIIHRSMHWKDVIIEIPKGLDYRETWRILVFVDYYESVPTEHYINLNGIIIML